MLPRPRPTDATADEPELLDDADVEEHVEPAPPPVPWAKGTSPSTPRAALELPTVADVYDRHATFVFRVLRGLGVTDDRLDDAVQDVFIVVHRRLAEFEARSSLTTWLYAIARRVASQYRRSAATRREAAGDLDAMVGDASPFEDAQRHEAARMLGAILDELDDDKRDVFVLIELEQLSAPDAARVLEIPVNTVYSRLRLARARFEVALARRLAREAMP
jgi:RNA polymerase sigma-70 factor (ECF subfamily)